MKPTRRATKVRPPSLGRVIARRILKEEGVPKTKVIVSIGLPRRHQRHNWMCPFLIDGVGESKVQPSYGVDAMQALILTTQSIRAELQRTGREFFWLDRKTGDAGFPILVHTSFGKTYENRVSLALEREMVRHWSDVIKRRREGIRKHEAKLKGQGVAPSKIARYVVEVKKHLDEWESELNNLKPGWSRIKPANEPRRKDKAHIGKSTG